MFDVSELPGTSATSEKYYISDIPRIDPEEKKIWTDALESDEYKGKQGKNMLKTPYGKFCCLGVYCEVKQLPQFQVVGNYRDELSDTFVTGEVTAFGSDEANTSTVVIPDADGIQFVDPPAGCFSWDTFKGEETIFVCQSPDDGKTYNWTLPGLNDSDAGFTFAHIRDIINYFL